MKAICIVGSPNRHGSTAALVGETARGMRDAGIETRLIVLAEQSIQYCRGCRACEGTRRCAQRDGMDGLTDALLEADVVCIGSPSWWGDVPAMLKNFIDRSMPLCDTLTGGGIVPPGKLGIAIAVRAGRSPSESINLIQTIEHYFGHLGIKAAAALHFEAITSPADLTSGALQQAYDTGRSIGRFFHRPAIAFSLLPAGAGDGAILARMNLALIRDEGSDNPMKVQELEQRMLTMLAGAYKCVLIQAGGHTAGYCLYRQEEGRNDGKPGVYLRQYYIKPPFRQHGLGRAALNRIMAEYMADAAFVELDVLECNATGRAFWARAGFTPVYHRLIRRG